MVLIIFEFYMLIPLCFAFDEKVIMMMSILIFSQAMVYYSEAFG